MIPQSNHFTCRTIIRIMYGIRVVQTNPDVVENPVERIDDPVQPTIVDSPEYDYPDRQPPEQERDYSDWLNPYAQEREVGPPDEYPFQDFNYGP